MYYTMENIYLIDIHKHKAYELLDDLFGGVYVLDIQAFIKQKKYIPNISSIFVVSNGGSYSYLLNGTVCEVQNGTLHSYGKLQINELQDAYLTNTPLELPKGIVIGMGSGCPKCKLPAYRKKTTVICAQCKCMFNV